MIDLSIFIDFYFTKYLIIASTIYGIFMIINKLIMRK